MIHHFSHDCNDVNVSSAFFYLFSDFVSHSNPVDTGCKLNVHKTFNLRPVSTGKDKYNVPKIP